MPRPLVSVIVPAYNEAAVIHRALEPLAKAAASGRIEVVVVANGCQDATVARSRSACPAARIFDLATASKTHALNFAVRQARGDTLVCLDADIALPMAALESLVDPLVRGEADISLGRMVPNVARASRVVRAFYRGWALNPYFDQGKAGGVIAMTRACADIVFPLGSFTSDDEYMDRVAAGKRRAFVPQATFDVQVPTNLRSLLAVRRRSRRGTAALERAGFGTRRPTNHRSFAILLRRALSAPARLPDVAVYTAVILWVRLQLAVMPPRPKGHWERDLSSRQGAQHSATRGATS